jgi:hypothetical protein
MMPINSRLRNWGTLGVAVALVAWPAFGSLRDDSFPLSNYPMFAASRGRPRMAQMVGLDAEGAAHRLTPTLLGSSEALQAKALVERAANGSNKQRRSFCHAVAARVHQAGYVHIDRLELARVRFDPIAYFMAGPEPLEREVLFTCGAKEGALTQ